MRIVYNLPHVFDGRGTRRENAAALRCMLDCLINLNIAYLQHHPNTLPLYRAGVVYGRTNWWEPIPAVYARGFGDCKSLTAIKVAQDRFAGIPARAVFRFATNTDDSTDYHILEQLESGFHDPSKVLGMGRRDLARFYQPGFYEEF